MAVVGVLVFGVSTAGADPPVFDMNTVPQNATVEATSSAGATFSYTDPSATDTEGPPTVSCNPAAGSTFPLGLTTVTCTATDVTTSEQATVSFTVNVVDTTGPTITPPGNLTAEATSSGGATVTYSASASDAFDGSVSPNCSPASGAQFPIGTTTVNCTATDAHNNSSSASFSVTVHDTTPPTLSNVSGDLTANATGQGGAAVSWPAPTATDSVDPSPTVTCTPSSGSTFAVGTTTVSCVATDHSGNSSPAQTFHVTVTDTVAPTLSNMPANITATASGPGGAAVGYTLPTATDNVDPNPSVSCSPPPGSTFPIGTTQVTCTATDNSGNHSSASFNVTVRDSTAPTISTPGNQLVEATGPGGAAVSFTVTASDNVDPNPSLSCTPASGSTFALGATTVNCTAHDSANNTANASFTVTVADTTPPSFSNVPSLPTFEANSAGGSAVGYVSPTAFDLVAGAVPVVCTPKSGSGFPIGTTLVDCVAGDSQGNIGHAGFNVTVADRTPPVISAPPFLTIFATTPTGVPSNDPSVIAAARAVTAQDNIDPSPVVTNDMPAFLPVGHTLVHFFASDRYGNGTGTNMDVNVLPKPIGTPPPLPPPPDSQPPLNVTNLAVRAGDRSVQLSWKLPAASDLDHVVVSRSEPTAPGPGTPVFNAKATKFTDRGLVNDTQYRYVVITYDKAGNHSPGLAILATPHVQKLLKPLDGAAVKKPPVLMWRRVAEADYYNVQLFRDSGKALTGSFVTSAKKILSAWPRGTRFALKAKWKFEGRTYRLTKGTYRWFVWPGFGSRAQNNYGAVLGENVFTVRK
jgi:fibronectin type 3 domain-containing protein